MPGAAADGGAAENEKIDNKSHNLLCNSLKMRKKKKSLQNFVPKLPREPFYWIEGFLKEGPSCKKRRKRGMETERAASIRACIFIYGSRNDAK